MISHGSRKTRTGSLLLILVLAFMPVMSVEAQDRMPPIPEDKMTEAQKKAIEEFKEARGHSRIGGPFVPLLRSPEILSRARAVGDYVRFNSVLPQRLSEFAILITARHWTQQYEWKAHSAIAERAGLDPKIIGAVAQGSRPEQMAEDESIVYDFCMELLQNQSVSDVTYTKAVMSFEEKGVIDTIGIVGYYSLLAMVMNTARTPLPEGVAPPLAPFPSTR